MLNLLLAITTGSALFLSFLIFSVLWDANTIANRWLAAFVLCIGCMLLDNCLASFDIYRQYPVFIGILGNVTFALAPTLYLSVSHFVSADKKFKKQELWHFLLAAVFLLLNLPFNLSSDEIKLQELYADPFQLNWVNFLILGLMMSQILVYWAFSMRKLWKHRRQIEQITASPSEYSLNWLIWLLYGVIVMILIWMIDLWSFGLTSQATLAAPCYLAVIWWLGYFALKQKEVFPFSEKEALEVGKVLDENEESPSSRQPMFSEKTLERLKLQLLQKMETEKPYLDAGLNLPGLAGLMGLSVHEMSGLVNDGFGENFAQFVNSYRVEESKRLLLSEKYVHLSMVGIAYEAGFNSKTAFNTTFKKMTGLSPTEYKKIEGLVMDHAN